MSWQRSVQAAVRALRKEEASLRKQLDLVQQKIQDLEDAGRLQSGAAPPRRSSAAGSRRLSAKGRAAISRAAKKRWAEYRRQKKAKQKS